MDAPARLFHLHFNTPDVAGAERRLAAVGLPPYRRFGAVDGESVALDADESVPDGFELRLQNSQRGGANVTLAPGAAPRFDHLGVVVPDVDAVVARAEAEGWSARDSGGRRTFLLTPWRFRVEVVAADGDVAGDLGSPETARFADVALAVPDPAAVREGFDATLGEVPKLRVEAGDGDRAAVPSFRLAGTAFHDDRTVDATDLL